MSTTSQPKPLSALVLPADSRTPGRRLAIYGARDLAAIVPGELEAVRSTAHRHLQAYILAGADRKGRPVNQRANRVMRPGCAEEDRIVGDVVLVGYRPLALRVCHLSEEQEHRITGPGPLHYPDRREVRSDRHLAFSWDLTRLPDGRMLQAALNISYLEPVPPEPTGSFVGFLTTEAVTESDAGRTLQGMCFGPLKLRRTGRFTKRGRDQFAEWMLDRVRAGFLMSDRGVHGIFRAP